VLQKMRQDWTEISGNRINLRIIPGGQLGDDVELLRKVRIGSLQATALTSIGLARIDPGIDALHIPMLFDNYAELDYVRDHMAPTFERRIAEKGFVVLNWADGGWAHFFSKKPSKTVDDLRRQTLWISAGEPKMLDLYNSFGFRVKALNLSELMTQLQTSGIDAVAMPPLFAMLDQTYRQAKFMTDLHWAPVVGGTVISKEAWEGLPANLRPKLLEAARRAGEEARDRIRAAGDEAVPQMVARGLTVVEADRADWLKEAKAAYPKLRGELAPVELFDEALRLRDEFRAAKGGK
jgi:TRAP-type C4-dicarboxylate transport system substrate-binding protein